MPIDPTRESTYKGFDKLPSEQFVSKKTDNGSYLNSIYDIDGDGTISQSDQLAYFGNLIVSNVAEKFNLMEKITNFFSPIKYDNTSEEATFEADKSAEKNIDAASKYVMDQANVSKSENISSSENIDVNKQINE